MERLFQEKRFARRYCIVFILHVQEHLYRGRVDQLLLCMAVLRYPLGIRRMFVWLVPHGYDIAGTVGIVAINFILDGIIGGGILIWRLVVATWYIPLTIYRLLTADKSATPQINIEKGFKSYE